MSSLSRDEEKILAGCSGRVKAAKWYESEKQSRQRLEADMWKREREKKVAQVAEKMAAAEAREKEFAAMKEKTARAESAQKKIRDRVLEGIAGFISALSSSSSSKVMRALCARHSAFFLSFSSRTFVGLSALD